MIMTNIQKQGVNVIDSLTAGVLKNLIRYRFRSDEYKKQKKPQLIEIAKRLYAERIASGSANKSAVETSAEVPENDCLEMEQDTEVDRAGASEGSEDDASCVLAVEI